MRVDPWVRKTPGEEMATRFSILCLENPWDKGAWWAIVPRDPKVSDMTEGLNMHSMQYLTCMCGGVLTQPCLTRLGWGEEQVSAVIFSSFRATWETLVIY